MAIGHVELNSAMTGVQDYVTQKHNEQAKPMVDQSAFQNQFEQQVGRKLTNVHQSDNADNRQKKFDARDKGSNEYQGDGGRGKKKEEDNSDGRVVPKAKASFDIKI